MGQSEALLEEKRKLLCATRIFLCATRIFLCATRIFLCATTIVYGVSISLTILTLLDHPNDYRQSS